MIVKQLDAPSLYGKSVYGKNSYPSISNNKTVLDNLPEKVVFCTYRNFSNESYYFELENITSDPSRFNKIEFKWNPVKNAIGYCIFRGISDKELVPAGYSKNCYYYFHEKNQGQNIFFKIVPLFEKVV